MVRMPPKKQDSSPLNNTHIRRFEKEKGLGLVKSENSHYCSFIRHSYYKFDFSKLYETTKFVVGDTTYIKMVID